MTHNTDDINNNGRNRAIDDPPAGRSRISFGKIALFFFLIAMSVLIGYAAYDEGIAAQDRIDPVAVIFGILVSALLLLGALGVLLSGFRTSGTAKSRNGRSIEAQMAAGLSERYPWFPVSWLGIIFLFFIALAWLAVRRAAGSFSEFLMNGNRYLFVDILLMGVIAALMVYGAFTVLRSILGAVRKMRNKPKRPDVIPGSNLIWCDYCGARYDAALDRCPVCGGERYTL